MPHFFITQNSIDSGVITISDKENYNHIARALHAKQGERLLLVDEKYIQYETIIEKITSSMIVAKIENSYLSTRILPLNLFLGQVVLKKEAQVNVIQKACELGIKGIYPLVSDNCTIKKSSVETKIEKYQKLAYEASKQCERPDVATIYNVCEIDEIVKNSDFDIIIACVEKHANFSLKTFLNKLAIDRHMKILVLIGPEGGFSEREFNLLKEYNLPMVSLGNLILKADTAVISALSNIIYGLVNE